MMRRAECDDSWCESWDMTYEYESRTGALVIYRAAPARRTIVRSYLVSSHGPGVTVKSTLTPSITPRRAADDSSLFVLKLPFTCMRLLLDTYPGHTSWCDTSWCEETQGHGMSLEKGEGCQWKKRRRSMARRRKRTWRMGRKGDNDKGRVRREEGRRRRWTAQKKG